MTIIAKRIKITLAMSQRKYDGLAYFISGYCRMKQQARLAGDFASEKGAKAQKSLWISGFCGVFLTEDCRQSAQAHLCGGIMGRSRILCENTAQKSHGRCWRIR
ncbi:MAG: hypothetical protein LUC21_08120 [Oscillospiraceae bacterium]|nr:hypothetical protein [Oscillospiraceae bacterium]